MKTKRFNKEEVREVSAFDRAKTKHEQFLSFAFNILQSDEVPLYIKHKTIEILKNIPEDAFSFQQKAILEILKKASEFALTDKEKFLDYALLEGPSEKYKTGELLPSTLTHTYYMESIPFFESFKLLGIEILNDWKKKKKEFLFELIKSSRKELSYEDLSKIAEEIYRIENYQLIEENNIEEAQERFLSKAAKPSDFNYEFEWLYTKLIPKGTINLLVAPPSQGKSAFALALGIFLLETGRIEKLLYFDADNPVSVHTQRHIDRLVEKYQGKLFYFKGDIIETAQKFQQVFLESSIVKGKILVVIDTLRAFAGAVDINKGEVAENIMSLFKKYLFDGEKTLLIIHHVNKALAQDGRSLRDRVKGATEFLDRADIAYYLEKKDDSWNNITIALTNIKSRIPVKMRTGFIINFDTWSLQEEEEPLSAEEKEFVKTVQDIIYTFEQTRAKSPNKYQLINELVARGFGRNQSVRLLNKFEKKFWQVTYDSLYNQLVYKVCKSNGIHSEKGGEVGELGNLDVSRLSGETRTSSDFPSSPSSPVLHSTLYQNYQNEKGGEVGELGNLDVSKTSSKSLDSSDFPSSPSSPPIFSVNETDPEKLDQIIENTYAEDALEQTLKEIIHNYLEEYYRRNKQYPSLDQVLAWCFWEGFKKEEVHMYLTFSSSFKLSPDKNNPHLIIVYPANINQNISQKFTDPSIIDHFP